MPQEVRVSLVLLALWAALGLPVQPVRLVQMEAQVPLAQEAGLGLPELPDCQDPLVELDLLDCQEEEDLLEQLVQLVGLDFQAIQVPLDLEDQQEPLALPGRLAQQEALVFLALMDRVV